VTNATTNQQRMYRPITFLPILTMAASAALPIGVAVEIGGSGTLQNLTGAGTSFVGFTKLAAGAAADVIDVYRDGEIRLTVAKATNWAATDLGATVYGSDNNTFTLVNTSNQAIGKVTEIESGIGTTSAVVWVKFKGKQDQVG